MPAPTLPVDAVPSEDPKKKKLSPEDEKEAARLKTLKEKEGVEGKDGEEELVSSPFRVILSDKFTEFNSRRRTCSSETSLRCWRSD